MTAGEPAVRVLVADDHTIVRESLVGALDGSPGIEVVAQAADGVEALEAVARVRPQVVLLDIGMPRLNGIEVARRLRETDAGVRVLMLSMHQEEEYVVQAIRAGAAGYLPKDCATHELIAAIHDVQAGRGHFPPAVTTLLANHLHRGREDGGDRFATLTPREREVFRLIADGFTTKEIARSLDISVKTAENHRSRVLGKVGVRNSAELVRYAVRRGVLG